MQLLKYHMISNHSNGLQYPKSTPTEKNGITIQIIGKETKPKGIFKFHVQKFMLKVTLQLSAKDFLLVDLHFAQQAYSQIELGFHTEFRIRHICLINSHYFGTCFSHCMINHLVIKFSCDKKAYKCNQTILNGRVVSHALLHTICNTKDTNGR